VVDEGGRLTKPETALRVASDITKAIGSDGMVAGQMLDMECENRDIDEGLMEYIHSRKTGRLIAASVRCGAVVAGASPEVLEKLTTYGRKLGLAFQIIDDILDEEGSFGDLKSGKGLDSERGKATYPAVFGLERSKAVAAELVAKARGTIEGLGEGFAPLVALADFVGSRTS
jgi:geranylgeranyl diphosphate synthase type II